MTKDQKNLIGMAAAATILVLTYALASWTINLQRSIDEHKSNAIDCAVFVESLSQDVVERDSRISELEREVSKLRPALSEAEIERDAYYAVYKDLETELDELWASCQNRQGDR